MKMGLKRLEPCAGKLARTVLRRAVTGNSHGLSDNLPYYVESRKITEEQASDIFDVEKQKMTVDKLSENLKPIT